MNKSNPLDKLTFCDECICWHPLCTRVIKKEYRGHIGYCEKPGQGKMEKYADDFCSRGRPKEKEE